MIPQHLGEIPFSLLGVVHVVLQVQVRPPAIRNRTEHVVNAAQKEARNGHVAYVLDKHVDTMFSHCVRSEAEVLDQGGSLLLS